MRIVVLFGSFNPLTNAHLEAMKYAKDAIKADYGLFVATDDRYLRGKMIRHGESMCLTQDERKEAIEETCKHENGLSYWGKELGGASPKRYQTLCRIKGQYPNAEIYEIEGADKISSLAKFRDSEEYVSNTHFLIIGRDDIDVRGIIESDELLRRNKDSFMILPPLDTSSDLSSTEVRRRFFSDEYYDDFVPESVAKILHSHRKEDYTMTFAHRMESLIKSGGRFGENKARVEVYKDNLRLFVHWKNGQDTGIDFGNYKAFLENTELYSEEYNVNGIGATYSITKTGCMNADCVDVAEKLIHGGYRPAILNLASAFRPGGGFSPFPLHSNPLCRLHHSFERGLLSACVGYPNAD